MEEDREVKTEDAQILADFYGIKYIETSALKGINVEESFRIITQEIYDKVSNWFTFWYSKHSNDERF